MEIFVHRTFNAKAFERSFTTILDKKRLFLTRVGFVDNFFIKELDLLLIPAYFETLGDVVLTVKLMKDTTIVIIQLPIRKECREYD